MRREIAGTLAGVFLVGLGAGAMAGSVGTIYGAKSHADAELAVRLGTAVPADRREDWELGTMGAAMGVAMLGVGLGAASAIAWASKRATSSSKTGCERA